MANEDLRSVVGGSQSGSEALFPFPFPLLLPFPLGPVSLMASFKFWGTAEAGRGIFLESSFSSSARRFRS